jgi:hypothetical protein
MIQNYIDIKIAGTMACATCMLAYREVGGFSWLPTTFGGRCSGVQLARPGARVVAGRPFWSFYAPGCALIEFRSTIEFYLKKYEIIMHKCTIVWFHFINKWGTTFVDLKLKKSNKVKHVGYDFIIKFIVTMCFKAYYSQVQLKKVLQKWIVCLFVCHA